MWATHYCASCNTGLCVKHATFDSDKAGWLCPPCTKAAAKPVDLDAARAAKKGVVNRPKRRPIWEEALAA